jgi:hypothetical protein
MVAAISKPVEAKFKIERRTRTAGSVGVRRPGHQTGCSTVQVMARPGRPGHCLDERWLDAARLAALVGRSTRWDAW